MNQHVLLAGSEKRSQLSFYFRLRLLPNQPPCCVGGRIKQINQYVSALTARQCKSSRVDMVGRCQDFVRCADFEKFQ